MSTTVKFYCGDELLLTADHMAIVPMVGDLISTNEKLCMRVLARDFRMISSYLDEVRLIVDLVPSRKACENE